MLAGGNLSQRKLLFQDKVIVGFCFVSKEWNLIFLMINDAARMLELISSFSTIKAFV